MNADEMVFITFSLSSDSDWMSGILDKMHRADMETTIICNSKFISDAQEIVDTYRITVFCHDDLHTKMVWFSDGTVWFGSQNFVKASNVEFLARVKDGEVAKKIQGEFITPLIEDSVPVSPTPPDKKK